MRILAPAKINLNLHVINKRSDGYHNIESLVCFANFGDFLEIQKADKFSLKITGEFSKELFSQDNLIKKATNILSDFVSQPKIKNTNFILEKNIPISAGMGGGSADAAAALNLLNLKYNLDLSKKDLFEVGKRIGADVPVCLEQKTSIISGVGEEVKNVSLYPSFYILLINPLKQISTAEIFANYKNKSSEKIKNNLVEIENMNAFHHLVSYLKKTKNHLQETAIENCLEVKNILDYFSDLVFSRMTGSGATCFALYENLAQAKHAEEEIKIMFPDYWIRIARVL